MALPLESQVCSLDLARRLKELGVKQESSNAWCRNANFGFRLIPHGIGLTLEQYVQAEKYSAFTVAELGEMLPESITIGMEKLWQGTYKQGSGWTCGYMNPKSSQAAEWCATEADARAKCLIYLIEEGLLDAKKIK